MNPNPAQSRVLAQFPSAFLHINTVQNFTGPTTRYMLMAVLAVGDSEAEVWERAAREVEENNLTHNFTV